MITDLSFHHNYEISLVNEIPGISGKTEQFYYPGASTDGIAGVPGGIWVSIIPKQRPPWMGFFAEQYQSPPAISAIASSPHPLMFCVISSGFGCIVNAEDPDNWIKLECFPILDVRFITSPAEILLFSDFTKLVAYGTRGKLWRTQDVCWDNLKIKEMTQESIIGTGWNFPSSKEMDFEVDLKTGRIVRSARM